MKLLTSFALVSMFALTGCAHKGKSCDIKKSCDSKKSCDMKKSCDKKKPVKKKSCCM